MDYDYGFFHDPPVNEQELALYISTEAAATVTVSITNTGYSQTLNIPANTVDATILIPKSGVNDARILTDGLHNKGIHIVSEYHVAVYAHVYASMVSGATMLMPVETYGYNYYSINYTKQLLARSCLLSALTHKTALIGIPGFMPWHQKIIQDLRSLLLIQQKMDGLPGNTYTVNLNKGELSCFWKIG